MNFPTSVVPLVHSTKHRKSLRGKTGVYSQSGASPDRFRRVTHLSRMRRPDLSSFHLCTARRLSRKTLRGAAWTWRRSSNARPDFAPRKCHCAEGPAVLLQGAGHVRVRVVPLGIVHQRAKDDLDRCKRWSAISAELMAFIGVAPTERQQPLLSQTARTWRVKAQLDAKRASPIDSFHLHR